MKRAIKATLGAFFESNLFRRRVRKSALQSVNVVYYHHIGEPEAHYKAFYSGCTIDKFVDDLKRLNRVFDFASLDKVIAGCPSKETQKRPVLAITFDDGFDLGKSGVMDVLDEYGVKATTFVITSCVDNRKMMWRHTLSAIQALTPEDRLLSRYNDFALRFSLDKIVRPADLMRVTSRWKMNCKDELAATLWEECELPPIALYLAEKRPYFSVEGLRDWIASGHSVGFHTHTHPYCSRLQRENLEDELVQPALWLSGLLGIRERYLSYPFGDRLQPGLELELFERGVFAAMLGIGGIRRRGPPNYRLERAGIEGSHVGWNVFAPLVMESAPHLAT